MKKSLATGVDPSMGNLISDILIEQIGSVLSDGTRLRVIRAIDSGSSSVANLASRVRIDRATARHHLLKLQAVGMIEIVTLKGRKIPRRLPGPWDSLLGKPLG